MNRMNNEHLIMIYAEGRHLHPLLSTLPTPFTTITHSPTLYNDNNERCSLEYGWMGAEGMYVWACMYGHVCMYLMYQCFKCGSKRGIIVYCLYLIIQYHPQCKDLEKHSSCKFMHTTDPGHNLHKSLQPIKLQSV